MNLCSEGRSGLQDSRQGASSSGRLGEQPVYIHLVGIEDDAAEKALSALGERGQRLILTSTLEVSLLSLSPLQLAQKQLVKIVLHF